MGQLQSKETGRLVLAIREPFLARALIPALKANGIGAVVCGSAQQALTHIVADPPPMLVMDADLSDHPGTWLTDQIHHKLKAPRFPVIELVDAVEGSERHGVTRVLKAAGPEALLAAIGEVLIPAMLPLRNAVHAVEVGRDWHRGARSRHVIREFLDRDRAESYLARLGLPVGWCAALIQVESEPDLYCLGFRQVRTLLVRQGPSPRLAPPSKLAAHSST